MLFAFRGLPASPSLPLSPFEGERGFLSPLRGGDLERGELDVNYLMPPLINREYH